MTRKLAGLLAFRPPPAAIRHSFFLVTEGRIADYLDAVYVVLKVDADGSSVVTGLAGSKATSTNPGH